MWVYACSSLSLNVCVCVCALTCVCSDMCVACILQKILTNNLNCYFSWAHSLAKTQILCQCVCMYVCVCVCAASVVPTHLTDGLSALWCWRTLGLCLVWNWSVDVDRFITPPTLNRIWMNMNEVRMTSSCCRSRWQNSWEVCVVVRSLNECVVYVQFCISLLVQMLPVKCAHM